MLAQIVTGAFGRVLDEMEQDWYNDATARRDAGLTALEYVFDALGIVEGSRPDLEAEFALRFNAVVRGDWAEEKVSVEQYPWLLDTLAAVDTPT